MKKIFKIVDAEVKARIEKTFSNFSEFVSDNIKIIKEENDYEL